MARHPLTGRAPSELCLSIDRLVDEGCVFFRELSPRRGAQICVYMYDGDAVGDDRLARGLIVARFASGNVELCNMPMPRFDTLVEFDDSCDRYYAAMEKKLRTIQDNKEMVRVAHQLDGTCIYGTIWHGERIVSTLAGDDDRQSKKACEWIGETTWEDGMTIGCELIWEDDDEHVQTRKPKSGDGLYVFYAVDAAGQLLTNKQLATLVQQLNNPRIRHISSKMVSVTILLRWLREMDDIEENAMVQKGFILHQGEERITAKSWQYLETSRCQLPTHAWFLQLFQYRQKCQDFRLILEEIHTAVETFEGPLDARLRALVVFSAMLERVRGVMDELRLRGEAHSQDGQWLDTEHAILEILPTIADQREVYLSRGLLQR